VEVEGGPGRPCCWVAPRWHCIRGWNSSPVVPGRHWAPLANCAGQLIEECLICLRTEGGGGVSGSCGVVWRARAFGYPNSVGIYVPIPIIPNNPRRLILSNFYPIGGSFFRTAPTCSGNSCLHRGMCLGNAAPTPSAPWTGRCFSLEEVGRRCLCSDNFLHALVGRQF